MESPHILIVDDNIALGQVMEFFLKREGYRVSCVYSGADALQFLKHSRPDLILLDLIMPQLDGWDVLYWVRNSRLNIPIIAVSGEISFHEAALDQGSDDFISRPTSPSVIVAHVKARLRERRTSSETVIPEVLQPEVLQFADVRVDIHAHLAYRGERKLALTPTEYRLLVFFLRHPCYVCERGVLLERVWEFDFDPKSNMVDVCIKSLREKLEEGSEPRLIQTIRGVGYVLREPEPGK